MGKYTTSGETINASFISGLSSPMAIGILGPNLYIANTNAGEIGVYDANTGAVIDASLFSTRPDFPGGVAVDSVSVAQSYTAVD